MTSKQPLPTDLRSVLDRAVQQGTFSYVCVAADGGTEELDAPALLRTALIGSEALLAAASGRLDTARLVPLIVKEPLSFVRAFFAAVCAGMVPVPLPSSPHVHVRHRQRLHTVLENCDAAAIVTDCPDDTVVEALRKSARPVQILRPPVDITRGAAAESPLNHVWPSAATVAYVQYTSGSLSAPKPVNLTHANVVAQLEQASTAFEESTASVAVNWVPLHHDMGLVTSVLRPLWSGYRSVIIDPFDFVRDPALWLRQLSRWGATHTSAPNFGYELAARKGSNETGLDLSRLCVARSAGEPVRAATLDTFTTTFEHSGFERSSFNPSYGLAEATLTVTATPVYADPLVIEVDSSALRQELVKDAAPGEQSTRLVSSGMPIRDTTVAVVDPNGIVLADDVPGEIWISGPQVCVLTHGAHQLGDAVGYLTGDMGFLRDGQLYLLGRAKEKFQVAGENFYSVDVEAVATAADSRLRPGRGICVIAQTDDAAAATPTLLLELRDDAQIDDVNAREIVRTVTAAVSRQIGLPVRAIGILRAGMLPRTTSGKLQRDLGRVNLEEGRLDLLHWYRRRD